MTEALKDVEISDICEIVDHHGVRCANFSSYRHLGRLMCGAHRSRAQRGMSLDAPVRRRRDITVRDELGNKECGRCHRWLQVSRFCKNKNYLDHLDPVCLRCIADKKHHLSFERKLELLSAQGYSCVCGATLAEDEYCIDHDHACCPGKSCGRCVRGLLCVNCNTALGQARDDPSLLRRLAAYLDEGSNNAIPGAPVGMVL